MGNVQSVSRAFAHCGASVEVTEDLRKIATADRLVLPGVGAFGQGISELRKRNIIPAVNEFVKTSRPFFGICLGLQLMFDSSEEAYRETGDEEGLGFVSGRVVKIPGQGLDGNKHKVPHIGWSSVQFGRQDEKLLNGIPSGSEFYFVHSFSVKPREATSILGEASYNGQEIVAIVQKDNLLGTQFHPEKSASLGLKMISNFLAM
jgi:glutamine amidotransferase